MATFDTPVIFIIFNRPDFVALSFPSIKRQRPAQLYIIADGPRSHKKGEAALCARTRQWVEDQIDWPCELIKDYSETNLGAGLRIASGLTNAFKRFERAIILEDDIVPDPEFFCFCSQLLEKHRDDESIHSISGFTPLQRYGRNPRSAILSRVSWNWGWATWRRAWESFKFDISTEWSDPIIREELREFVDDPLLFAWHSENFQQLERGTVNAWDFQWSFRMLKQRRYCLMSTMNLVKNVGFGNHATHTFTTPGFAKGLKAAGTCWNRGTGPLRSLPWEKMHDRLFGLILTSGSDIKIRLARLLAGYPSIAKHLIKF